MEHFAKLIIRKIKEYLELPAVERPWEVSFPGENMLLSSQFIEKYKHKIPPFGGNGMGEIIYLRTYARWIPELGRREEWYETVQRVVEYNMSLHLNPYDLEETEMLIAEAEELYDNIFNLRVFPAGRTLWIGGTEAAKKFPMANFNCLRRDTKFVTKCGIKSFQDFNDGDEVEVLTETGAFKTATVKNFGPSNFYKIKLNRGKTEKVFYATENHIWFKYDTDLSHRKQITTADLMVGDKLVTTNRNVGNDGISPNTTAIQHGIVFGDGTFDKKVGATRIHLWDDSRQLEKYFIDGHKVDYNGKDSDRMIVIDYLPWNYKELPPLTANKEYLYGFLMGWFAADGGFGGATPRLFNKDGKILQWAKSAFAICGIYCGDINLVREESPFDQTYKPLYSLSIFSSNLNKEFFLKENHKKSFNEEYKELYWTVSDEVDTDFRTEDSWCIVEPETNTFVLENGILTHNCSFRIVDDLEAFTEIFYLLMLGCGTGFRILPGDVKKLPLFSKTIYLKYRPINYNPQKIEKTAVSNFGDGYVIIVGDSKEGWVEALREYFKILTTDNNKYIEFDFSYVRPKGSILHTFGGRASGPDGLMEMFENIHKTIQNAKGSNGFVELHPIDALDIMNIIAYNVVVGGVRRSSQIALFDINDTDVLNAKVDLYTPGSKNYGKNWRAMSNNSIFFVTKPTKTQLRDIFKRIEHNGEPGFVNAEAASWRRPNFEGINPCAEILLDNKGVCNLTEVNVRAFIIGTEGNYNLDTIGLERAIENAVRIGLRQTNVTLELPDWDKIQKRDRLTGVSLTGVQDAFDKLHWGIDKQNELLEDLKDAARHYADEYARYMRIASPLLVTTIKPSGTISQLPTVSSGAHRSFAPYYIRRVRITSSDPLADVLLSLNYPVYPETGQGPNKEEFEKIRWEKALEILRAANTWVFEFPVKTDADKLAENQTAIEQIETYERFQTHWTEHNTSITVYFSDDEIDEIIAEILGNWNKYIAISFLPVDHNNYNLMPYEVTTAEDYHKRVDEITRVPIKSYLNEFENGQIDDNLDPSCATGICPVR